ncbi:MAG TPA: alpha/beta hydrolase [Gammaproteobacteria bacterium]|nr:esterase [Gammaproteobacteria bacterium]HAK51975.1 alpha/beta hydrolase [Gammaproteobacteria bacterium]
MQADIRYNQGPVEPLHLDYYPGRDKTAPLVVWIHGGAWLAGSRKKPPTRTLHDAGYAIASISYRLTDVAVFPAQIQDCKCAIRFLRAHADVLGFDTDRIGVWGESAGGHLAAMMALTHGHADLEGSNGYLSYSSQVQAACDWFGPTDLVAMPDQGSKMDHASPDSPEGRLVGGHISEYIGLAELASPVSYASADSAPMLIVHGTEDPLIPLAQSTMLFDQLKRAGADVRLSIYKGSGHGDGAFRAQPALDEVLDFFSQRLPF